MFLPERVLACSYVKLGSMHGVHDLPNYLSPSLSPISLTIQYELLILQGIDINSPHYWSKQFGMFKKTANLARAIFKSLSFSKQTNHLLIYVLQLARRTALSKTLHY